MYDRELDDIANGKPTESHDSVETGDDMGGKTNAEAWWADCFPQWKGR